MSHDEQRIGPWKVLQPLTPGGMSDVFLCAQDGAPDLRAVVKVLNTAVREQLDAGEHLEAREVRALVRLRHDSIPAFLGADITGPRPFVAMEYIPGPSLAQVLRTDPGLLTPGVVLNIALNVADALVHTHSQGVVHRDIKPANVVLRGSGADTRAFLVDWGIARIEADPPTLKVGFSTPDYLPPEFGEDPDVEPNHRGRDLYGFGLVLWLLCRRVARLVDAMPAERRDPMAWMAFRLKGSFQVPDEHAALAGVVQGLLHPEPTQRIQSAADLLAAVQVARASTLAATPGGGMWTFSGRPMLSPKQENR